MSLILYILGGAVTLILIMELEKPNKLKFMGGYFIMLIWPLISLYFIIVALHDLFKDIANGNFGSR